MSSAALGRGLVVLLLLATLNEGGAAPTGMMLWHALLVGLVLVHLGAGRVAERREFPSAVLIAGGVFLALFTAGAVLAPYRYAALLVAIELACCVAVAWLASAAGAGMLRTLSVGLSAGAVLHGCHAIFQSLGGGGIRSQGTFLNANHLGLWLVMALLVGVALLDGPGRVRLAPLVALPILAGVALSGSRGALLGLLAGAAWLLPGRWARLPSRARVAVVALVLLGAALILGRLHLRSQDYDPFRYQRFKIWKASLGTVLENPLWGSGPGQFGVAAANHRFPDGEGPLRFDRGFTVTHSDLLRGPAELGLPTTLALLLAIGFAVRSVRRRRDAGALPDGADAAIAALIALGVAGLFDNPSRWPAVYLVGSALAGCLLSRRAAVEVRPVPALRAVAATLLVLVFLVADVAPYAAWREMRDVPRSGPLSASSVRHLEAALRLNPLHPGYRLLRAEHLSSDPAHWTLERYALAREAAEHAVRLQPADARYRVGVARVDALGCRALFRNEACRERVRDTYLKAETLSRYQPTLALELAGFLLDTGDPAGARRAAERALALEPEAVLPRLLLADAFIEGGSPDGVERARRLLAEAAEKSQVWADGVVRGAYARELLQADPAIVARLQAKIAREAAAAP